MSVRVTNWRAVIALSAIGAMLPCLVFALGAGSKAMWILVGVLFSLSVVATTVDVILTLYVRRD